VKEKPPSSDILCHVKKNKEQRHAAYKNLAATVNKGICRDTFALEDVA